MSSRPVGAVAAASSLDRSSLLHQLALASHRMGHADVVEEQSTLVLRGWALRFVMLPLYGLFLFLFGVASIGSGELWGVIVGTVIFIGGVVAVVRAGRAALIVDSSGITIRNVLYTKRWTWAEIGEVGWDDVAIMSGRGSVTGVSVC